MIGSATHIHECIDNYARYLESGGQILNWDEVFDARRMAPIDVLQHLIESYIFFGQNPSLVNFPDRLEAFDQIIHSCLHDLLIHLREGRQLAREDWRYLQTYLHRAFKQKKADKTLLHRLVLQVTEVGFQLDAELLELSRFWMEARFEENLDQADAQPGNNVQPLDGFVGELLLEAEVSDEFSFYEAFANQSAYLSLDALMELFAQALQCDHRVVKESVGLFVLHPQPSVRHQALRVLNLLADQVSPVTLKRLVQTRNWHAKADQVVVDECVKRIKRATQCNWDAAKITPTLLIKSVRHMASTIDGSGAQNVVSFFKVGSEFQILGGVVKERVGWIDLWVSVPTTRKECETMLREMKQELYSLEVSEEYVNTLIPIGLGWNCARGELASPLLLEWAERLEVVDLNPRVDQETQLFKQLLEHSTSVLDGRFQSKALASSRSWLVSKPFSVGWFESSEQTEQCIDQLLSHLEREGDRLLGEHQVVDEVVTSLLTPQREKWCKRFVRLAYWAKENTKKRGPNWEEFLALAVLLNGCKPLEEIPLMREIGVCTLSYHLPYTGSVR